MRKSAANLTVNLGLLLISLIMAFSGFLIQTEYHIKGLDANERVFGLVYFIWSDIHIFSSVFVATLMIFHIVQHWKWYKIVFTKRLFAKNQQVILLSLIFLLVAITGFIPWIIDLHNGDQILRKTIIEVHDKIAIILFVYLVFHVVKRFKWYATAYNRIKHKE
jgi:hypothetical protein